MYDRRKKEEGRGKKKEDRAYFRGRDICNQSSVPSHLRESLLLTTNR
ncbi:hypothetical protein QUB60_03965 [Microcoleus sp. A2-C5]